MSQWDYRIDKENVEHAEAGERLRGRRQAGHHAEEEADGKHTGGGVISKRQFEYGYYEARFKVPPGSGWHTSFWAMIYNAKNTVPAKTQEIDFCEQDSVKTTKYSAGVLAWDQKGRGLRAKICGDARPGGGLPRVGVRVHAGQGALLL